MAEILGIVVAVFVLSWGFTWGVRRYAMQRDLLDHPNARSSHQVPTPRGGGVAIVAAFSVGLLAILAHERIDPDLVGMLLPPALLVAAVGFWDDHGHVKARYRLLVHFAAAAWCAWWLLPEWAPWVLALVSLALAWFLNLFNFMDGIDGIAAGEAVFLAAGAAAIELATGHHAAVAVSLVLGASAAGFLVWNWPPARIFMGDIGSGFLGLVLGAVLLHGAIVTANPWPWLILPAVFVVDASLTLARRLVRRERVHEAHRSHAYQVAARRWGHRRVTAAVLLVDVLLLLPLAVLAVLLPEIGMVLAIGSYAVLSLSTLLLGAGKEPA